MKLTQFVETTKERYDAYVEDLQNSLRGRVDITATEIDNDIRQVKVYHNPVLSDIGQIPQWGLVALSLNHRHLMDDRSGPRSEHNQYFVLKVVEMGVTHREVGKWTES